MSVFEKYRDEVMDVWPEAEEVERVKNTTKFRLGRDAEGRDLFKITASPGPMFYEKKGDGKLLDLSGAIADDKQEGFASKVDVFGYNLRVRDDSSRTFYPREGVRDEYIDFDRPQHFTKGAPEDIQWDDLPVKGESSLSWTAGGMTMLVEMKERKVKVSFLYADASDVTPLRLPFTLNGISRVGRELFSTATGERVGLLDAPTVQAEGLEPGEQGQSIISEKLTSSLMDITIDTSGLKGPVVIDPTFTLAASDDDGYWDDFNACGFNTGNSWCYVGMSGCNRSAWLRYVLTIANGATISAASIDFRSVEAYNETAADINIKCELASDPSIPSSNTDAIDRTKGSSVVNWLPSIWADTATTYTSPDISSVIQEIVNQGGFVSGNHGMIYLLRNSSVVYNYRQFSSYDGSNPAILSVTTAAAASTFVSMFLG